MRRWGVLVAFLAVFCVSLTSSGGTPPISWTPAKLSVSLLRGSTNLVGVAFTSTTGLPSAEVFVVPELHRFVTVSPVSLTAIPEGSTVNVSMVFSIPEDTPPGAYDGAILVRRANSGVLARPLPVELLVQEPSGFLIPQELSIPSRDRFTTDSVSELNYARNEIIVFVVPGATVDDVVSLANRFGATFLGSSTNLGFYQLLLPFDGLADAEGLVLQLENDPLVDFALPHFFPSVNLIPNDPSWSSLARPTQSWAQDLVKLPAAWELSTGDAATKVGFVDLGFDFNHEDLVIDLTSSNLRSNFTREHGTRVASVATAVGNNTRGLAGVMWSSNAHLFSCSANQGNFADEPMCWEMVREAISRGVRVINVSISTNFHPTCHPGASIGNLTMWLQRSEAGWRRATSGASNTPGGVLFVFGAGNDFTSFDFTVPARLSRDAQLSNVVSVGAIDRLRNQASYSNFGSLTVWAPGGDNRVSLCGGRNSDPPDIAAKLGLPQARIWGAQPGDTYVFSSPGTSLAAPFVAGVAGLILSANPNLTAGQVRSIIETTADPTGESDPSGHEIRVLNAFRAVQQALAPPISQLSFARTELATGIGGVPRSVTSADFNADGNLDLAVGNLAPVGGTGSVSVMLGRGDGTFNPKTDFAIGASLLSLTGGDFNGDGKVDLAGSHLETFSVSVLLGNGDGTFGPPIDTSAGTQPSSVVAGDFNQDGRLDLAAANSAFGTVSILLGNGNGAFGSKSDFPAGAFPLALSIADFNQDGKLDVAVANTISNTVSVLLGNGDGTLGSFQSFAADAGLHDAITSDDFNQDGNLDLVLTNRNSNTVSIFPGIGDGTFGARSDFFAGLFPFAVTTGDFDRDGKLDISVALNHGGTDTLSVLPGNGDGTFETKIDFLAGAFPHWLSKGDFNVDGKLDLAVANAGSKMISILLNTSQ